VGVARSCAGVDVLTSPPDPHPALPTRGLFTLTKHKPEVNTPRQADVQESTLDSEMFVISGALLATTIREELEAFFSDADSPTLGEYAVLHIVGHILRRVAAAGTADISESRSKSPQSL
jgi:hypothetical protein